MKSSNYKISLLLGTACILMLALFSGLVWSGIGSLRHSMDATRHIANINTRKIELLEEMSTSVHDISHVLETVPLLADETMKAREQKKIEAASRSYHAAAAALTLMPFDANGQRLLSEIAEDQIAATSLHYQFAELSAVSPDDATAFLLQSVIPVNTTWQEQIQRLSNLQMKENKIDIALAEQTYQASRNMISGTALLIVVLMLCTTWISIKLARKTDMAGMADTAAVDAMQLKNMGAKRCAMWGATRGKTAVLAGNMAQSIWREQQHTDHAMSKNPAPYVPSATVKGGLSVGQFNAISWANPSLSPDLPADCGDGKTLAGSLLRRLTSFRLPGALLVATSTNIAERAAPTLNTPNTPEKPNRLTAACDKFLALQNRIERITPQSPPKAKPVLRLVSNTGQNRKR